MKADCYNFNGLQQNKFLSDFLGTDFVHWQEETKQKLSFAVPVASFSDEEQNKVLNTLFVCGNGLGAWKFVWPSQIRGSSPSIRQKVKKWNSAPN